MLPYRPLARALALVVAAAAFVVPASPAGASGADLAVSLRDLSDPVPAGVPARFVVEVVNQAAVAAPGATVDITVPRDWDRGRLESGNCVWDAFNFRCRVPALAPNAAARVATFWLSFNWPRAFTTQATVTVDNGPDVHPADDTDSESTTITQAVAEVRISQPADNKVSGTDHEITAMVTDHQGAPVPDGTPITFQVGPVLVPEYSSWFGFAPTASGAGYRLAAYDGTVLAFGDAALPGTAGPLHSVVEMRSTPSGRGYWLAAADGTVRAIGDAAVAGSPESAPPGQVASMAVTPSGLGYWLATADGQIFAFGDARSYGSVPGAGGVVAIESTPSGRGYWLATRSGAVHAFGDARFLGDMASIPLPRPVVDLAPTPSGNGYWLVAEDGGIFTFGEARFHGTTGERRLSAPIVRMAGMGTGAGQGYWMLGTDGSVFGFGEARFQGPVQPATTTGGQAKVHFTNTREGATSSVARVAQPGAYGDLFSNRLTTTWRGGTQVGPVPPAPPSVVQASAGNGGVFVTWSEPAFDGGSPVTRYTVTASPGALTMAVAGDTTWAAFTGLDNGTTYVFTVTAHNAAGSAEPSPASNPVTPSGPLTGAGPGSPARPGSPPAGPGPQSAATGYWMLGADGAVYAFGDAAHLGNPALGSDVTAVDLEPTPSGHGYWVLDSAGTVHCRGDARDHGDPDPSKLAPGETLTSLSATPTGGGYWVFTTRGRVLTFGDADSFGDVSGIALNGPVLDSIPTPSGRGYYMVAADGGIFTFGDAAFTGSMGGTRLNAPVRSLVPDGDGAGYWLVASDGGIFAFDAPFRGSLGGVRLNRPITGMARFGDGYLMVGEDGGIFNFSDRPFHGSLGATPPARPVVSMAARG